jgi:hypothetical protein
VAWIATAEVEDEEATKNPLSVAAGKLGGLKGGKARAMKVSERQRSEIARKGGLAKGKARAEYSFSGFRPIHDNKGTK